MAGDQVLLKRPLNAEERTLCEWLIEHGSPEAAKYATQLDRVSVVGHCTCGCPTIYLAVDGISTSGPSEVIGDAIGDSEGLQVGVWLHCKEGQLSELEVCPFEDRKEPFRLPRLDSLRGFARMIVGNPSIFAIESQLTEAYEQGLMGLGSFTIHVLGHRYGVKAADATMLGVSFGEVRSRIAGRGQHTAPFSALPAAEEIANAYVRAIYTETEEGELFFGLPLAEFEAYAYRMQWADPAGDAAFDDGSYVLHSDVGDRVRLIAFRRNYDGGSEELLDSASLRDLWLSENDFYDVLQNWRDRFEAEWTSRPKVRAKVNTFPAR